MRNLSKPVRILISAVLFAVCYIPINLLWMQVLPAYSRVVAGAAEAFVNIIEFSDTTYRISVGRADYEVVARVTVPDRYGKKNVASLNGSRKLDLVSYNMVLWAAMLVATFMFITPSARWKFLLIAPAVIFLWHLCDLTIFCKNTRWILVKDLSEKYPSQFSYSYSWHWFWYWAKELNRRIIDPFLPLLLWIVFGAIDLIKVRK